MSGQWKNNWPLAGRMNRLQKYTERYQLKLEKTSGKAIGFLIVVSIIVIPIVIAKGICAGGTIAIVLLFGGLSLAMAMLTYVIVSRTISVSLILSISGGLFFLVAGVMGKLICG
jgi:hypothetical protein